jgi:WD40 repeat protein
VTIWDSVSLSIRHQLNQGVRDWGGGNITFSPDSKYLASGLGAVKVWNVADGTLQTTLIAPHITTHKPQYRGIESLCYSPDGRMLVVVYTGDKQIVIAYRIADGKVAWTYEPQLTLEPKRTKGSSLLTTPLVFTPDGKRVIFSTGEWSGYDVNLKWLSRILLLDAESGEFLRSIDDIHMNSPTALALSHDGKWVATGTSTGERYQRTNRETHQVVTFENKDPVRIWNVATGKLVRELPVHSRVWSLAFSQDGKYLFGATRDINVWDTESGKMVQVIKSNPEPMSLALSPDGKRLAAACQSKLSIYEIMNFP